MWKSSDHNRLKSFYRYNILRVESPSHMPFRLLRISRHSWALFIAATMVAAVAACDGATGPESPYTVYAVDTQTVYPLNGSYATAPTALSIFAGAVGQGLVRANSSLTFDIAFDMDSSGNAVLKPVRAVASQLAPAHRVGLQVVNTPYAEVGDAPKTGYRFDTTMVVAPLRTVLIESSDPSACAGGLFSNPVIYAKLVVLEVNRSARTLRIRYTGDPNCGKTSLTVPDLD